MSRALFITLYMAFVVTSALYILDSCENRSAQTSSEENL